MKELLIVLAVLVARELIGFGMKRLIRYVQKTETKIDDAALSLTPSIVKAVKNGLSKANLNNEQTTKLLNTIKHEYLEQAEKTDFQALAEMEKAEQEAKKQSGKQGKS